MSPLLTTFVLAATALLIPRAAATDCGSDTLTYGSLTSSDRTREFCIYFPPGYDEAQLYPLLLSFHGNGKDMTEQATLSRFNDSSVNPDMVAVFPNGLPNLNGNDKTLGERCWEGAPYCCNGEASGTRHCESLVSDKQFVSDLVAHLIKTYNIDSNQIFATGKSIGGGLVELLACSAQHGGDFAAFGIDAGAMYAESVPDPYCSPARKPMPILELHGTLDHVANYNGGTSERGDVLPNVRDVLTAWAERNGCSANEVPVADKEITDANNPTYYYTEYGCNVFGYNVTGQGHWWISTQANEENNGTLAPIDASHLMLEFFRKNPKPSSHIKGWRAAQERLEL